jgi:hypothetical protein
MEEAEVTSTAEQIWVKDIKETSVVLMEEE